MKLVHKFAEMTPEQRPQDPHLDGAGLRFETMEHGGEYPGTIPRSGFAARKAIAVKKLSGGVGYAPRRSS